MMQRSKIEKTLPEKTVGSSAMTWSEVEQEKTVSPLETRKCFLRHPNEKLVSRFPKKTTGGG